MLRGKNNTKTKFFGQGTPNEIIMELKRVVVTGIGAVTPVGNTAEETWANLLAGKSGAAPITSFDTTLFKTKFACEVKGLNINDFIDRKEARKMDRYTARHHRCQASRRRQPG